MLKSMLLTLYQVFERRHRHMVSTSGFFRNIAQADVLFKHAPRNMFLLVFGCADGCEVFSTVIRALERDPGAQIRAAGFDINAPCIDVARRAVYKPEQVEYYLQHYGPETAITPERAAFFDRLPTGELRVVQDVRDRCTFEFGDVFDPRCAASLPQADVIFFQNAMIHLNKQQNRRAIEQLIRHSQPGTILAIAGMSPAIRARLTQQYRLEPITDRLREIHDGWLELRGIWHRYPRLVRPYVALEPYRECPDSAFRYGTLFRVTPASISAVASARQPAGPRSAEKAGAHSAA